MTTGKTISLTRWVFVGKVISLLFNMLSSLVITFYPRSKDLLILWLQSPSAVILEPPKIKSVTVSTVSSSICHEVMEPEAMIIYSLDILLFHLEPVCCSMSGSDSCFLTYMQFSQEAGKGVCYSHLFKNFPQIVVIHSQRL